MALLQEILSHKMLEVDKCKRALDINSLKCLEHFSRSASSLKRALMKSTTPAVIAEIKRRSPSKGILQPDLNVKSLAAGYASAGAAALSVLTDQKYFGGSIDDLQWSRRRVDIPILRKEFIIDGYQIVEAKAYGADAILLIASALSVGQLSEFIEQAHSIGLEVLLEVHSDQELLSCLDLGADLIGVNSRNLSTLKTDLTLFDRLASQFHASVPLVAESGIENPSTIHHLKKIGYSGFLIGHSFLQTSDPALALSNFLKSIPS
ncbi:MAG: indole-3-glycerol phosphate synthase TrpC [Bacteroidetes bacterium]|nr:indole-3-glycerol phosphate synthase TrpC [Bacteroidota bacterium]